MKFKKELFQKALLGLISGAKAMVILECIFQTIFADLSLPQARLLFFQEPQILQHLLSV